MEDYKLSDGKGAEERSEDCVLRRYPIKSNGPVEYEIPDDAKFYRISWEKSTDTFFLEMYANRCRNCREVQYARAGSGKATKIEIKLGRRSAVSMKKKWIFG